MREVEPAAWDGLLAELGLADAYYRRAYVESACVLEPGEPLLLEHEGTVLAAILRNVPGTVPATASPQATSSGAVEAAPHAENAGTVPVTARDAITPYGFGGPAGGDLAAFWPAYESWCRERGVVTTFLRFHPLSGNAGSTPVHLEELAPTIGWRLEGDLLAGMHAKHRNAVRKAEGAGLEVVVSTGLGEFVPLYEETMRRAAAAPFYFFAAEYWRALESLGDALVGFDALTEDQVVASALCLASPPWLHYHLGGTAEAGRKLGATTLLLYEAAQWARERGYQRFHLGGGVGGGRDSLHEFKRRFDPGGELPMAIGKAVHDAEAYRALGGDPDDLSGYFPGYRSTAAAALDASR